MLASTEDVADSLSNRNAAYGQQRLSITLERGVGGSPVKFIVLESPSCLSLTHSRASSAFRAHALCRVMFVAFKRTEMQLYLRSCVKIDEHGTSTCESVPFVPGFLCWHDQIFQENCYWHNTTDDPVRNPLRRAYLNFVGRENELDRIHDILFTTPPSAGMLSSFQSRSLAIHGNG